MGMSANGAAIDAGAASGAVDHDVVVEISPAAGWSFGNTGRLPGVTCRRGWQTNGIHSALGEWDDGIEAAAGGRIMGRERRWMPILWGRSQAAFVIERDTGQVGGHGVGFGFEREEAAISVIEAPKVKARCWRCGRRNRQ